MNALPNIAKHAQILQQCGSDPGQFPAAKSVILPHFDRASGTVHLEYNFVAVPDDMNMGRPMIVGINDNAKAAKPEDGRHKDTLS
jgi:hypothetical protein